MISQEAIEYLVKQISDLKFEIVRLIRMRAELEDARDAIEKRIVIFERTIEDRREYHKELKDTLIRWNSDRLKELK